MKYLVLLSVGVAGGFLLAHTINSTPRGSEFFTGLDGRLKGFTAAVSEGYRSREAELRDKS